MIESERVHHTLSTRFVMKKRRFFERTVDIFFDFFMIFLLLRKVNILTDQLDFLTLKFS